MRRRRSGPISVQLAVSTFVVGAVLTGLAGVAPLRRAAAEKSAADRPAGDKTATEKAREHFRSGEAFFKLEKYQEALSEYEQGYIAKSDPSFLYNIAQCHRLMGNKQAALRFYKRFLTEATRVPNREMVETHIRDLEKALAASRATPNEPPPSEQAAPPPPPVPP
ncbi:MAG TPA: tetratricopeptide repeat protein, partial [Polyangia bacterium]